MKVSIIVPIYNVEKYIAECAHSLFSQDYDDIEFIFVDDCSPDNSISILHNVIKQYPNLNDNIRILRHEQNQGLGAARLTGILASNGDAIMHVDSDDILPAHSVSLLAQKMIQTNADIIHGGFATWNLGNFSKKQSPSRLCKSRHLKRMLCQDIAIFNNCAKLYKRELFINNDVLPIKGIDYAEDFCIIPRLFYCAKKIARLDEIVYLYRIDNSQSYTHTMNEKNIMSNIKANNVIYNYFKQKRKYSFALKIGMLNNWRKFRRNGYNWTILENELEYVPQSLFERVMIGMFRSRCPFFICNIIFKSIRNLYCIFST